MVTCTSAVQRVLRSGEGLGVNVEALGCRVEGVSVGFRILGLRVEGLGVKE